MQVCITFWNGKKMKNRLSSDTYQVYILLACLTCFWLFSLAFIADPTKDPVPNYYYAYIVGIFGVFVIINQLGRRAISDQNSTAATLMSNTIPISVVLLPFLVVMSADGINALPFIVNPLVSQIIGYPALIIGIALVLGCEVKFKKDAGGTLSPIEELNTQKLVTDGLYAYMRNPMIIGGALLILGLALSFQSNRFLAFFPYFVAVKTIWFKYSEEPSMERRFGQAYVQYKNNVSRWVPRLSPYQG